MLDNILKGQSRGFAGEMLWTIASLITQIVVLESKASMSPGSLQETHNLRSQVRPTESNLCFNKIPRQLLQIVKLKNKAVPWECVDEVEQMTKTASSRIQESSEG